MTEYEKELMTNIENVVINSRLTRNEHIYFLNGLKYLNDKLTAVVAAEPEAPVVAPEAVK